MQARKAVGGHNIMSERLFRKPMPSELLEHNQYVRIQVEKALAEEYPHLDPTYDPAPDLLEGKFREEMDELIEIILQTHFGRPFKSL